MCLQLPQREKRDRICAAEVRRKKRSLMKMLSNLGSMEVWEFIRRVIKAGSSGSSRAYLMVFFVALRPNAGHGLLILEVSRSHTTHHIR
jgi:hypothetical protein